MPFDSARDSVSVDGKPLAVRSPLSRNFSPAAFLSSQDARYALSRFAYLRADGGELLLESPRALARVVLHDSRAAAVVQLLARSRTLDDLTQESSLSIDVLRDLLELFVTTRMALQLQPGAASGEEESSLQTWEFHDLLFHARSRAGRHDAPIGGSFRFAGARPPAPALETIAPGRTIALDRPDLARLEAEDPPFARVQEARSSIRDYAAQPITRAQLGEFLYRVGRVIDYWESEVAAPGPVRLASAARPYPAAGALYELELYCVVNRCDGVDKGLYYYQPDRHHLASLDAADEDVQRLLDDAAAASGIYTEHLQIVIVIAGRFQRIAWKYASIAYSLLLKDVGVLLQTMYLAATAMRLAPCALGCGDPDLFARAAGTDYYQESSVGEFLLGTRADA